MVVKLVAELDRKTVGMSGLTEAAQLVEMMAVQMVAHLEIDSAASRVVE